MQSMSLVAQAILYALLLKVDVLIFGINVVGYLCLITAIVRGDKNIAMFTFAAISMLNSLLLWTVICFIVVVLLHIYTTASDRFLTIFIEWMGVAAMVSLFLFRVITNKFKQFGEWWWKLREL
ncbi:MAG: hypothetical protein WCJ81_03925 [bacterium]